MEKDFLKGKTEGANEIDSVTFENAPKIELPESIQKRMLEFFMRTSIPRMKINFLREKKEKEKLSLSEKKED